jgi:LCP family protein required for cell wall assembly
MQHPVATRPRRRRVWRGVNSVSLGVAVAVVGSAGLLTATQQQADRVERVGELEGVLSENVGPFENYLLVGSDTREGVDPSAPDFGGIGDTTAVQGRRSDTLMVLHVDYERDRTALLSIPRDLWVEVAGERGANRINSAYQDGADVLVRTVQEALGIPVHHYVEVDFESFKDIVGAIGGVQACFDAPTRDLNTGLAVPVAGCFVLDPVQALAYARSRYYEEWIDGEWQTDPRADLGRIERQQLLAQAAVNAAIEQTRANPLRTSELVDAAARSLRVDPGLDLVSVVDRLRPLAGDEFDRYTLPVEGDEIDGKAVLVMTAAALPVLTYFAGTGPPPPPESGSA